MTKMAKNSKNIENIQKFTSFFLFFAFCTVNCIIDSLASQRNDYRKARITESASKKKKPKNTQKHQKTVYFGVFNSVLNRKKTFFCAFFDSSACKTKKKKVFLTQIRQKRRT